jgi:hypothetical protein
MNKNLIIFASLLVVVCFASGVVFAQEPATSSGYLAAGPARGTREAMSEFTKALEVDPTNYITLLYRGNVKVALVASSDMARPVNLGQDIIPESNPKAQALKLYTVIKNRDWKSMYSLTLFSTNVRQKMPSDPEEFASGMRKGISDSGGDKTVNDLFNNMSNLAVGEPVVRGDKAAVPTSSTITMNGSTLSFKGTAHMTRDGDLWKWDLTFTDDTQAAVEQELQILLGKPR